MATRYQEDRQGWGCIPYDGDDPRINNRGEGLSWCEIQLPKHIVPDHFKGKVLRNITKVICAREGHYYLEGCKLIWEKREDDPECYDLAFDAEGFTLNPA